MYFFFKLKDRNLFEYSLYILYELNGFSEHKKTPTQHKNTQTGTKVFKPIELEYPNIQTSTLPGALPLPQCVHPLLHVTNSRPDHRNTLCVPIHLFWRETLNYNVQIQNIFFLPEKDQKGAQAEFYITRIQMSKRNTMGDVMSGNVCFFFVSVRG